MSHWLSFRQAGGILAFSWLVGLCTQVTRADFLTIANASFEDTNGQIISNEFSFGTPTGWQIYNPNNNVANLGVGPDYWLGTLDIHPPTNFSNDAPDGARVAIAFNFRRTGGGGAYGLVQTLNDVLEANSSYALQVEVGNIASGRALNGQDFLLAGFPGYRVELLAGSTVIASDNNSLAGSIPEGQFRTSTVNFQVGASHALLGQALGIRLINLNVVDSSSPDSDLEVDFDFVRLNRITAVPECSSIVMVSLALPILFGRRRGQ